MLEIAYTPQNEYYSRIIKRAADKLSLSYKAMDTVADLDKYLLKNQLVAGVIFSPYSNVIYIKYV